MFKVTPLILVLLITIFQFILLKPIIGQGLTNEDYAGLFAARLYKNSIVSDPVNTWLKIGPHNASHFFYLGFLDLLFGENYNMYLITGIFLKMLATFSLYPLILVVFKNRILAFLGTLIYGLSFASAGALALYSVSDEYH